MFPAECGRFSIQPTITLLSITVFQKLVFAF